MINSLSVVSIMVFAPKVAVLEVETVDVDPKHAKVFTEVVSTEAANAGKYAIISTRDIEAALGYSAVQQQLGCDDTACLTEIGGALGVDFMLSTQVSKLDGLHVVSMKLIDVHATIPARRVYRKLEGGTDLVLGTLRASVYELFELPIPDDLEAFVDKGASLSPWYIASFVLGAGGIATGVGFGLKAKAHHEHATSQTYVGAQQEIGPGRTSQTVANIGFAAGGALLALGGALLVWDLVRGPAQPTGDVQVGAASDGTNSFWLGGAVSW